MIAFAPYCRAARPPALCTGLQAVPSLRAGPSSSPAHSPIPPTLRSTKEGHFHPGQALLKIPSFVPLRDAPSLCELRRHKAVFSRCRGITSVRPALPRPHRGQASRQISFFRYAAERDLFTLPARRRPVGSGPPPHFVQFQTGPSLNRRGRYAFASHVAAPLCGQACGAVAPQPSRHRRITPSSVPSGVPLCGLPFRESPAAPVSPSGLRPFTLSPQSRHGSSYVPQRGVAAHRRSFRAGPGVAFGYSGRHAVAWRSVQGKRCFPFRRSPVPGEGSGKKKNSLGISKASMPWNCCCEKFQCLEIRPENLPTSGKIATLFSGVRKNGIAAVPFIGKGRVEN